MSRSHDIRQLYAPIQPTANHSARDTTYLEFSPDIRLQDFIYCYWQFKTTRPLTQKLNHVIVADGCIDIFFELNSPQDSYVMGFCKKYTEFHLTNSFTYVGVRFLPTMFPQLFNINAAELSNRSEPLGGVIPATAKFIESNFGPERNIHSIKSTLDNYFLHLVFNATFDWDKRIYDGVQLILKKCGVIDIEHHLDTGISHRQLRRLFQFYIGDTAKTFSKVVRFQNVLRARPSPESLRQEKFFF